MKGGGGVRSNRRISTRVLCKKKKEVPIRSKKMNIYDCEGQVKIRVCLYMFSDTDKAIAGN